MAKTVQKYLKKYFSGQGGGSGVGFGGEWGWVRVGGGGSGVGEGGSGWVGGRGIIVQTLKNPG